MSTQTTLSFSPTNPSATVQPAQIVLVLCGVVGTGKSTFAEAMERQLPNWERINQDELKSRGVCETRSRKALSQGKSIIIDRQNFDRDQRSVWIHLAREFPRASVRAFVLGTTEEECIMRLKTRRGHPTVATPSQALALLDKFIGMWEEPDLNEGFDRLIVLPSLPPSEGLTPALLSDLLKILDDSPAPVKRQPARRR